MTQDHAQIGMAGNFAHELCHRPAVMGFLVASHSHKLVLAIHYTNLPWSLDLCLGPCFLPWLPSE